MAVAFDPAVLEPDPAPRADVLAALEGALAAADPRTAVARCLARVGRHLEVGGERLPLPKGRVVVLAFGKAGVPMAEAALEVLAGLRIAGLVVAPSLDGPVGPLEGRAGEHPLPGTGSLRAGRRLLALAREAGPDDLVLALVSGGGSALVEVPAPGLTLHDFQAVTRALLAAGAPITELNTVRRHLSSIKGGRLAEAAFPARLATLVLSDVVHSPLEAIAGGPTIPDPTTPADALGLLSARGISMPAIEKVLRAARPRTEATRTICSGPVVIIADGRAAARGAARAARGRGVRAVVRRTAVEGEAAAAGRRLAVQSRALSPGEMAVFSGETTVTVTGPGRGGRNQELALAAGLELAGDAGPLVASFATDGVDGPTDAAGGFGDGGTAARGRARGLDAAAALAANDSYTFLGATRDRLHCGPTGTNVGDVLIAYRPR